MTLFADRPVWLLFILGGPVLAVLNLPAQEHGTPLPSLRPEDTPTRDSRVAVRPLPGLTTYRAHMMLMTVLAILAVDFRVFPRDLAKCETWGTSLMDLGVGSFVFSQGIVSALPILRDPTYLSSSLLPKLASVTSKSFPIILLGLARVVLVKGTEYPEHVTEYGVHWNFFITLALLPIIQTLFHPVLARINVSLLGFSIAVIQQTLLSYGLEDYVLNAPRTSLLSANKEGISSLLGYLSIHLLGLGVGLMVLPPVPSFFARRQERQQPTKRHPKKLRDSDSEDDDDEVDDEALALDAPRQLVKTATELGAYSIVWWGALGLWGAFILLESLYRPPTFDEVMDGKVRDGALAASVSRQMVNLPYILWVAAYNTSFLLFYIAALDLGIIASADPSRPSSKFKHKPLVKPTMLSTPPVSPLLPPQSPLLRHTEERRSTTRAFVDNPPELLRIVNKHSLAIFLMANLLTGVINLSVQTIYAGTTYSMFILCAYSVVLIGAAWMWDSKSQKTKRL